MGLCQLTCSMREETAMKGRSVVVLRGTGSSAKVGGNSLQVDIRFGRGPVAECRYAGQGFSVLTASHCLQSPPVPSPHRNPATVACPYSVTTSLSYHRTIIRSALIPHSLLHHVVSTQPHTHAQSLLSSCPLIFDHLPPSSTSCPFPYRHSPLFPLPFLALSPFSHPPFLLPSLTFTLPCVCSLLSCVQ